MLANDDWLVIHGREVERLEGAPVAEEWPWSEKVRKRQVGLKENRETRDRTIRDRLITFVLGPPVIFL